MQTVRLNRAALAASAAAMFILLCVISYLPSSPQNLQSIRAIRSGFKSLKKKIDGYDTKEQNGLDNKEKFPVTAKPQRLSEVLRIIDNENDKRQEKVVEMMLHAWNGYKNYSWGANELRPLSKTSNTQNIFGGPDMPATIIDAADTLFIMGLKDEYKEARDYIEKNFDMSKATRTLSVFETNIRFLGGLLSLYALTGEEFYKAKARSVGEALLPAFKTPSGIPKSNLNMMTKQASNYHWANGGSSILAEFGSLDLEFTYLSHITKAPIFAKRVKRIRDVLDQSEKVNGLYPNYIDPGSGRWSKPYHMSLGALGDSFYEYLIKSWLQSGKTNEQSRRMFWEASKAIREQMIYKSKSGLTYTAELSNGLPQHKMGHLACFSVGMFALQAVNEKSEAEKEATMKLAEELGQTCHESYTRSASHIGPEMFYFNDVEDATSKNGENGYILRPEVIEGFFYLWRLTGKKMYRDWVWDAIQAIDKHCRVEGGFSGIYNVYNPSAGYDDVQQSFFLAETLKYAYLTFTDPSVISLDKWVFNTEAHPLPIMTEKNIVSSSFTL